MVVRAGGSPKSEIVAGKKKVGLTKTPPRIKGKPVAAPTVGSLKSALKGGKKAPAKAPTKKPTAKPAAPAAPEWFKNGVIDPKTGLQTFTDADSTYLDTQNSVNTALNSSLIDNNAESQSYDTTFLNDLRDLGLQGGNFVTGTDGKSTYQGGTWDMNDALTQSGKAFSDQANDFASRGMMQSSGYGTAGTNLSRALTKQVANANLSRQTYQTGLSSLGASQQQQASDALTQAKREAIARRANKYATNASAVMSS